MPAGNWYPGQNAAGYDVKSSPMLFGRGFASQPPAVVTPAIGGGGSTAGTYSQQNNTGFDVMVYVEAPANGWSSVTTTAGTVAGTLAASLILPVYLPAGSTITFVAGAGTSPASAGKWFWQAV